MKIAFNIAIHDGWFGGGVDSRVALIVALSLSTMVEFVWSLA